MPAAQANKLANEKARCLEEVNIALFYGELPFALMRLFEGH
ncbi:hypothetical protein HMPREF9074_09373 [Capnocytophaga sp. oral taxon 329 str. F0087]|nr:hypothetical protein HMPREF9074_09373 [Capnocytophaga sp. oral taxon 329 str. F0087]